MGRVVHEMHLSLQEPDPVVQLRRCGQCLVCGCIAGFDERGVVRRDFGDVAVFSGAEFGVVIAGRGVCGLGGGGC
jgi:hypothetical protein